MGPPGVPLSSGFRYLTPAEAAEVELSPEAKARVLAKLRDVDRARLEAAVAARTAIVG